MRYRNCITYTDCHIFVYIYIICVYVLHYFIKYITNCMYSKIYIHKTCVFALTCDMDGIEVKRKRETCQRKLILATRCVSNFQLQVSRCRI